MSLQAVPNVEAIWNVHKFSDDSGTVFDALLFEMLGDLMCCISKAKHYNLHKRIENSDQCTPDSQI